VCVCVCVLVCFVLITAFLGIKRNRVFVGYCVLKLNGLLWGLELH
jgi:hypothetical protein